MIDRLRAQIQQRLDQLASEADRLRQALAALDPRPSSPPARRRSSAGAKRASKRGARTAAPKRQKSSAQPASSAPAAEPASSPPAEQPASSPPAEEPAAAAPRRAAQGATRAAVLEALGDGQAMTAGEVAAKTGLGRGSVSTTLSKLAKSGQVQRAERGYRLATGDPAPTEPAGASAD